MHNPTLDHTYSHVRTCILPLCTKTPQCTKTGITYVLHPHVYQSNHLSIPSSSPLYHTYVYITCSEYHVYYVHCKFCMLKNELIICTYRYQILASSWNFTKTFQSFVSYISFGNGLPSDPGTIPSRGRREPTSYKDADLWSIFPNVCLWCSFTRNQKDSKNWKSIFRRIWRFFVKSTGFIRI